VRRFFDAPVVTAEDTREAYGEQRMNLLGWLHGRVVCVFRPKAASDSDARRPLIPT
jgi:uncharacterized DUF497 family protein